MRFLSLLFLASLLHAQTYAPRVNTGARLEPKDSLMHGAGQDLWFPVSEQTPSSFSLYSSVMPADRKPMVYMFYLNLNSLTANWADTRKLELQSSGFVTFQLGLSMTDGVANHYEAQVAAGVYDTQIGYLIKGLRELATPVYLRIGYEFDGAGWNGYVPGPYVQAFQRIAAAIHAALDLEVATVWDAEIPDGTSNYADFYPGDSYVDWFGANVFKTAGFSSPELASFIALAIQHNKPVLMGELTPIYVGAQGGADSWNSWYIQFFNFLANTPQVKQFNYIDWYWPYWSQLMSGSWPDWGDSRLEIDSASYVRNLYVQQLADPVFLHSGSESSFRQLLGYNDTTPPPAPSAFLAFSRLGCVTLSWEPVADPSGIARYYLYRNGSLFDYSLGSPYTDLSVESGTQTYVIAAMDRAGNLSSLSAAQTITVEATRPRRSGTLDECNEKHLLRKVSGRESPGGSGGFGWSGAGRGFPPYQLAALQINSKVGFLVDARFVGLNRHRSPRFPEGGWPPTALGGKHFVPFLARIRTRSRLNRAHDVGTLQFRRTG